MKPIGTEGREIFWSLIATLTLLFLIGSYFDSKKPNQIDQYGNQRNQAEEPHYLIGY